MASSYERLSTNDVWDNVWTELVLQKPHSSVGSCYDETNILQLWRDSSHMLPQTMPAEIFTTIQRDGCGSENALHEPFSGDLAFAPLEDCHQYPDYLDGYFSRQGAEVMYVDNDSVQWRPKPIYLQQPWLPAVGYYTSSPTTSPPEQMAASHVMPRQVSATFPLLPQKRSDPPLATPTLRKQSMRFDEDLYTAAWVCGEGAERAGWCGYCSSWHRLKDSAYWVRYIPIV